VKDTKSLIRAAYDAFEQVTAQFADRGELCVVCQSYTYDGQGGVVHAEDCIVPKLWDATQQPAPEAQQ